MKYLQDHSGTYNAQIKKLKVCLNDLHLKTISFGSVPPVVVILRVHCSDRRPFSAYTDFNSSKNVTLNIKYGFSRGLLKMCKETQSLINSQLQVQICHYLHELTIKWVPSIVRDSIYNSPFLRDHPKLHSRCGLLTGVVSHEGHIYCS